MLACLSPNGRATYSASEPATRLLVGTVKGVITLERSGASWETVDHALDGMQISALVTVPNHGLVFAGTAGRGLYVSSDTGHTWQLRAKGMTNNHVFAMALDDRAEQPVLYAGMLPPALYRSRDLGKSWEELPSLNEIPDADKWNFRAPPGAPHVKNIAFDPQHAETLYVCIEQGGLMVSHDSGRSWQEIATWFTPDDTFYRDAHRLAIHPSNPHVMYMATGDGLCKTIDRGTTWQRLTTGKDRVGYPDALFIDPDDDDTIYIAGAGGHPGTWDQQTARPGMIRSTDGGHTWQELNTGLPQPVRGNIEAVTMIHSPAGVAFYAGTAVGEIYESDVSEDRGASWRLIATLSPVSKAGHFRKFLSPEERARVERELLAQVASN
jgi:photosystem II stability/assembly factor-like uncharacterized protein